MKYDDLSNESRELIEKNGITWNKVKGYVSNLHKEFYLKEDEVKSEKYLKEYCDLIQYLKEHLEYGVNKTWADSEINRYVYKLNRDKLNSDFPLTIESLSRFYNDSGIIAFYKSQGAKDPTVIDLIGTTGAGKTTFCQQFVDESSKKLLQLTITDSGESTVIQTDILILDKTEKKLFLKIRNKDEIIRDMITVALEVELDGENRSIKKSIRKNSEIIDKDTIDKVSNYFITEELIKEFKNFAEKVQKEYKQSDETYKLRWIQENTESYIFVKFLDDIMEMDNKSTNSYGDREELNLEIDAEYKIITTIANTEFEYRKEDSLEYEDAKSYRLLYEHAILVLPYSDEAKDKLEYDFEQGLVFRDSQGHRLDEQNGIASDFEVKNKIFLIPIDSGGYLIDDRYSNIFEKILISQPKNNLFVLTKIDTNNTYRAYKESGYFEDKKFNRAFSEKVAKTHNKLLSTFKNKDLLDSEDSELYKDETMHFENFMASFDNAYLSEVDSITYASDAHKIIYSGKALEDLDKSKLKIEYLESWFDIVGDVLKENRLTYHKNISRLASVNSSSQNRIIQSTLVKANTLVKFYISKKDWSEELEEQLQIFNKGFDFRTIYQDAYSWYWFNFLRDGQTTITDSYFKDITANMNRDIRSYISKSTKDNYVKQVLVEALKEYLNEIYTSKSGNSSEILGTISNEIISNSLEKAFKICYKVYDRDLKENHFLTNIMTIYKDDKNMYIKPTVKTFDDIIENVRRYGTYTEDYEGIYSNLLSKFKYNLETYFQDIFTIILEDELERLDEKIQ